MRPRSFAPCFRLHGALAFVIVILFASGGVRAQTDAKQAQEDDIREAVFRSQLTSGANFLSIDGKDPSNAFMKRFEGTKAPVWKLSRAVKKTLFHHYTSIQDRETGDDGTILELRKIKWLDDSTVEVQGGYDCGSLCAADGIFRVAREKGAWVVKKFDVKSMP